MDQGISKLGGGVPGGEEFLDLRFALLPLHTYPMFLLEARVVNNIPGTYYKHCILTKINVKTSPFFKGGGGRAGPGSAFASIPEVHVHTCI